MADAKHEKQLKDYVVFQLSRGRSPEDMQGMLEKFGYSTQLIRNVMSDIKSPAKKGNTAEMNHYIQSMLRNHIQRERHKGQDPDRIKQQLIRFGHDGKLVDSIMQETVQPHTAHEKGISPVFMYIISMIALLSLIIYTADATKSELFTIFASFLPSIVTLTAVLAAMMQMKTKGAVKYIPIIASGLCALVFVAILQIKSPLLNLSSPQVVLSLNVAATFLLSSMMAIISKPPHLGERLGKEEKAPVLIEHPHGDRALHEKLDIATDKVESVESMLERNLLNSGRKNSP